MTDSPRTARDALLAAILGDTDKLLDRVEEISALIESLSQKVSSDIQSDIEKSSASFNKLMISRTDDFVDVANETLGLFEKKTQEIQNKITALQAIKDSDNQPVQPEARRALDPVSLTFGAIIFIAGLCVGILFR